MADNNMSAKLPVESPSIQAELQAAFARIASVPAGRTLVDSVSSELWGDGDLFGIEAGCLANNPDELDASDEVEKRIA